MNFMRKTKAPAGEAVDKEALHEERMQSDPQYKNVYLKNQKNAQIAMAEGTAVIRNGLASEIAKLNQQIRQRDRERLEEDRQIKKMIKAIKKTIRDVMGDQPDNHFESEGGEEEEETASQKGLGSGLSLNDLDGLGSALSINDLEVGRAGSVSSSVSSSEQGRRRKSNAHPAAGEKATSALSSLDMSLTNVSYPHALTIAKVNDAPCSFVQYPADDNEGQLCYVGQLQGNDRHGLGIIRWNDGSNYSGEWFENDPNGYGVERYSDGSNYSGQFSTGLRSGYGQFEVSPGVTYLGEFWEGEMNGAVCILEAQRDGTIKTVSARSEDGQIFREPDFAQLPDNDPRKDVSSMMQKVQVAIRTKVFHTVALARKASQMAYDLATDLSHVKGLSFSKLPNGVISCTSRPGTGTGTRTRTPMLSALAEGIADALCSGREHRKSSHDALKVIRADMPMDMEPAEIFNKFCDRDDRKMDFKNFLEILTEMNVYPKPVFMRKAQEIFRFSNLCGEDSTDYDTTKLDVHEFQTAYARLAEFLGAPCDRIWAWSQTHGFSHQTPKEGLKDSYSHTEHKELTDRLPEISDAITVKSPDATESASTNPRPKSRPISAIKTRLPMVESSLKNVSQKNEPSQLLPEIKTAESEILTVTLAARNALSQLQTSTETLKLQRQQQEAKRAHILAGNAALDSAKGKFAGKDFDGARVARQVAVQSYMSAGMDIWDEKRDFVAILENQIDVEEEKQQKESELKAHERSGDSAVKLAQERLALDDIAGANAASAAAASFYDKAGVNSNARRRPELEALDKQILQAVAKKQKEYAVQERLRAEEDEQQRQAFKKAEEEAEFWKTKAEVERVKAEGERVKAETARTRYTHANDLSVQSPGTGRIGELEMTRSSMLLESAERVLTEDVRQARQALELLALAKEEAQDALEAMQRACSLEEQARAAQERADLEAARVAEEKRQKRIAEDEAKRVARETKRLMDKAKEDERRQQDEGLRESRLLKLQTEQMMRESMAWPTSKEAAKESNKEQQMHMESVRRECPNLQRVVRRALARQHCFAMHDAVATLWRCLLAKWDAIEGMSIMQKERQHVEDKRKARDAAERKRLAQVAEATKSYEAALTRFTEQEAAAREALNNALLLLEEEVKRIRELDEGDRTLKVVEEAQKTVTRQRNQRHEAEQLERQKLVKAEKKRISEERFSGKKGIAFKSPLEPPAGCGMDGDGSWVARLSSSPRHLLGNLAQNILAQAHRMLDPGPS